LENDGILGLSVRRNKKVYAIDVLEPREVKNDGVFSDEFAALFKDLMACLNRKSFGKNDGSKNLNSGLSPSDALSGFEKCSFRSLLLVLLVPNKVESTGLA
jgi:hypothetical protein